VLTTPQHNNNMTKENTKHYIAFVNGETHLTDDLPEIFDVLGSNNLAYNYPNTYIWYLTNPSKYAGFCSSGIPKFGPLDQDNKLIGIPIYLGNDPHNARIVQKHMMSAQNNYQSVQKELAKY